MSNVVELPAAQPKLDVAAIVALLAASGDEAGFVAALDKYPLAGRALADDVRKAADLMMMRAQLLEVEALAAQQMLDLLPEPIQDDLPLVDQVPADRRTEYDLLAVALSTTSLLDWMELHS